MSCICCHSCPFTLRVELNFSHYVMIFWWLYHILECLQRTAIGLDWTKVTASCGMWLNREEKVWWCGASQPSLISYAACLVSSRLRLLSKHEYVTLQWVGALPSLKHISSHSPLLFLFFFFLCLSIWFDSGKSWGELVGSVQQWLFFLWHRGGGKGTGLSTGRRHARVVHSFEINQ